MNKVIAVIPARGGSKGLSRKNLQLINNVPLVAYSISVARKLNFVSRVIVSTDDSEIAKVSAEYGAEIVSRSKEISQDLSRDHLIFSELLERDSKINLSDLVIFLRPTHPIRNPEVVHDAFKSYLSHINSYNSLRSMKLSSEIIFKTWYIDQSGYAIPAFNPNAIQINDPSNAPRQTLPNTYYQDGYVDIFPISNVTRFSNTNGPKILPYIIDDFSQDIDSMQDLNMIEEHINGEIMPSWFEIPTKIK
jgi:CMP-N-acetylneuraminic acid synthetase